MRSLSVRLNAVLNPAPRAEIDETQIIILNRRDAENVVRVDAHADDAHSHGCVALDSNLLVVAHVAIFPRAIKLPDIRSPYWGNCPGFDVELGFCE